MVSSKSRSVSPGKPTMMSEVSEMSRFAALVQAMRSRYHSRVYSRCIAWRTAVEPDCTGKMHMIAEGRDCVDSVDDVLGEVAGMRGGEANALDSFDFAYSGKELGEGALAAGIAIAVDVLAEELDLGEAELRDALGFCEHRG